MDDDDEVWESDFGAGLVKVKVVVAKKNPSFVKFGNL